MIRRVLKSETDTALLAQELVQLSIAGKVIALEGDLGAGKTTLVRYLVVALGGRSEDVASPTFALEHEYQVKQGLEVDHWDLYRLRSAPAEVLEPPASSVVRVIEWASNCSEISSRSDLTVTLSVGDGGVRMAEISGALESELLE